MTLTKALTDFQAAMIELDMVLTGKDRERCEHTAMTQAASVEEWLGREYYLSDGGYSRVMLSESSMWVTSNSLDRVKTAWNAGPPEISRVRDIVRQFFREHDFEWGESR